MSEGLKDLFKNSESLLRLIEILAIIGTVIYVFAVQSVKVEQQGDLIDQNAKQIQMSRDRADDIYVRKDVFNQQYNQIIYRLDQLTEEIRASNRNREEQE